MMLSAASSHRLLPLLDQALQRCKEEEKQLEEQLRKWRRLLDNWDGDNFDPLKQDEVVSEAREIKPSMEDLQEVELLNKALEKALKVRGTSKTDSTITKTTTCVESPATCLVTKEQSIKVLNKPTLKGTRPATYQLHPPYKTIPDRRKIHRPGQRASTRVTPPEPPASKIRNISEGGQLKTKTDPIRPCSALEKPTSPPSTTPCLEKSPPQKPSTLKEIGATLKLPVEYQQIYMKNSRLWEKFYAIQDHLPASRASFIQKLQTTFARETPQLSLFEIEEETRRLQSEVRGWQQNVDDANNWQGSGPPCWQNYRSLLLLETLQEEVAKYQSELQNLQLVAEEYKKWAQKHNISTSCPESVGCPSMYNRPTPVLVYSQPGELRELTRSQMRVLELQQKIHLQKVFSEVLLAEAESWSRSTPTSCLPFRAIYTELCEGGDMFPVLVQDDG